MCLHLLAQARSTVSIPGGLHLPTELLVSITATEDALGRFFAAVAPQFCTNASPAPALPPKLKANSYISLPVIHNWLRFAIRSETPSLITPILAHSCPNLVAGTSKTEIEPTNPL